MAVSIITDNFTIETPPASFAISTNLIENATPT